MSDFFIILSSIRTDIFIKLFNNSITAGYIVLAVLLLRLLLKKSPKWIRGILWGIVGIRLIVPFSLESIFSLIPSAEIITPESVKFIGLPTVTSGIGFLDNAVNQQINLAFKADFAANINPVHIIFAIAGIVWSIGFVTMLLYAVISTLKIKKQVKESVNVKDNVFACDRVSSPFILGVFCPKIFIPSDIDSENANLIISHEKAHIGRRDNFWKPLGFLLLSVYWFNPLMWLGYVFLCKDIELACDEKVIKNLEKEGIADYSEALLKFSSERKLISACPIAFGEVGVKERVRSVLEYKKPALWVSIIAVALCIITAVCLLTSPVSAKKYDEKINDKMKITLDTAIHEQNKSKHDSDAEFSACAYEIFGTEKNGEYTVLYTWVLYEEYICENNGVNVVYGVSCPAVFTVDTSENGDSAVYKVMEYRVPGDGSKYTDDIKEMFPEELWKKVFGCNSGALQEKCTNEAKVYFYG